MRRLLARLGSWLNRKLNIVASPEESAYYDRWDRIFDEREGREP